MDTRSVISLVATVRAKANQVLKAKLAAAGLGDIDPSYGSLLAELFQHGERTMMELADGTQRDKSTVTTLVGRTEALGYVARRRNPEDGRSWLVALTKEGEAMRQPFVTISEELLGQAYAGFTKKEKETLVRLLRRMAHNL